MRYRLRTLLIAAPVVAVLCVGYSMVFQVERGEGVSASQANRRLWNCLVPDDATDVWFSSAYRGTIVECTLPEQSFQEWCIKHGGKPTQITTAEERFVFSRKLEESVLINDGLYFMNAIKTSPDIWHRGVYDRTNNRAYFDFSGG